MLGGCTVLHGSKPHIAQASPFKQSSSFASITKKLNAQTIDQTLTQRVHEHPGHRQFLCSAAPRCSPSFCASAAQISSAWTLVTVHADLAVLLLDHGLQAFASWGGGVDVLRCRDPSITCRYLRTREWTFHPPKQQTPPQYINPTASSRHSIHDILSTPPYKHPSTSSLCL